MKRLRFLFCLLLVTCTVLVNVDKVYAELSDINNYIDADIPFSWNSDDNTQLFF